jgi:hypothetical protein
MKNKKIILGGVALLILIAAGVALFLFNSNSPVPQEKKNEFVENFIELSAADVGLALSSQKNNQQLVMELTKLDNVESFEYEVSYEAIEDGEVVRQGTFGSGPNPDEKGQSTIKRVIDLGTCSAVCRYHKGVKEIEFTLKVNLTNGEVGIIEEIFVLE